MRRLLQKVVFFFELQSFGVCEWWARRLGIRTNKVRLGFIYLSFRLFFLKNRLKNKDLS